MVRIKASKIFRNGYQDRSASALVITLVIVTLLTVLVVALLITSRFERTSSGLALARSQAEILADLAADTALSRIREGIEAGTPNYNPAALNRKTWASMPGRIAVFDLTVPRPNNVTYYDLFSGLPGVDDPVTPNLNNVDLNQPSILGTYPIAAPAPGNSAANMKVGWINLLADQGQVATKANPVVGRIAFWVDDETCKVNINTADGSKKSQMLPDGTVVSTGTNLTVNTGTYPTVETYGYGTPSEISLAPLLTGTFTSSGTTTIVNSGSAQTIAAAIAYYASNSDTPWASPTTLQTLINPPSARMGFNSAAEVSRAPGVPAGFYQQNLFNITPTCRTPELNMFGEPRIYIFSPSSDELHNNTVGPWGTALSEQSWVNFIYPISPQQSAPTADSQLPLMHSGTSLVSLPQYLTVYNTQTNTSYLQRITNYLTGTNSQAQAITWPRFEGATSTSGFLGKYSLRQIETLAENIKDMQAPLNFWSMPQDAASTNGLLTGKPVPCLSRFPLLTEMFLKATATLSGSNTVIQLSTVHESYCPKYYTGAPWHDVTGFSAAGNVDGHTAQLYMGRYGNQGPNVLNMIEYDSGSGNYDHMLTLLTGTSSVFVSGSSGNEANYVAAANPGITPFLFTNQLWNGPHTAYSSWNPGVYHAIMGGGSVTVSGTTDFKLVGGYSWTPYSNTSSSLGLGPKQTVPLTALSGTIPSLPIPLPGSIPVSLDITRDVTSTFYDVRVADPLVNWFPADWKGVESENSAAATGMTCMTTITGNMGPFQIGIYGRGGTNAAQGGVDQSVWTLAAAQVDPPANFDGDNPEYIPNNTQSGTGGDPVSVWWFPAADPRLPKQAVFPSIGALCLIRTGVIPDDETVPVNQQHGTPWRSISLTPASSSGQAKAGSTSAGTGSYPDWAMLDLFTVPFLPEPCSTYVNTGTSSPVVPPARVLTYGGATEGRMNINNPQIPYPFSEPIGTETPDQVLQTRPQRTAPLDALFYGVQTSITYDTTPGSPTFAKPIYTTIGGTNSSDTPVATLRNAVQTYLTAAGANKPCFMIPGELANLPAIDAFTFKNVASNAWSRNDLMRSIIGALTTQSNTYSIWVVAQTVKKAPRNNVNYGTYEAGDTVTGEVRRHYIVERLIEPGTDGVPGNGFSPGTPATPGTEFDTINANYNPAMTYPLPYRWRIISVEDVAR